jgi:hypothetical protein
MEQINDRVPEYIHNKHTTYENTVLQMLAGMHNGFRDTAMTSVQIETQARIFVAACLGAGGHKFIDDRFDKYTGEEGDKIKATVFGDDFSKTVHVRAWTRIIEDAFDHFCKKYKVTGSRAKISIIDDTLPDGRHIIEADQAVEFTDDEDEI